MPMNTRRAGVLLHVSSLPSRHGLGDFGPEAHAFADFLARSGQSVWQMLPLTPINAGAGNSPYSSYSAFAGNVLFISVDLLARSGLVRAEDIHRAPDFPLGRVDYSSAAAWRMHVLEAAFDSALPRLRANAAFEDFCQREEAWLDDYVLFMALKREQNFAPWFAWPMELRLREEAALRAARARLGYSMLQERFYQYLFARQWRDLRRHCTDLGIAIMGDAPIYVSLDSCDVWANRGIFELDDTGLPVYSAGAPPDYFSATGQMWGNPVYAWERLERTGFSWWIQRLAHESRRYDLVRLDHFRGFCAFWQVPACEPTAENGSWIPGPGEKLFEAVSRAVPDLRLVAEDLGVITPDVTELMGRFGFPGMKVLQFAFSENMGQNTYIPHNVVPNSVAFTGTHDNNTTRAWFAEELGPDGRERLRAYVGWNVTEADAADVLIRLTLASVADLAIIPMQDYLGLDGEGRMNMPGVAGGNWGWRLPAGVQTEALSARMRTLAHIYGR